MFDHLLGHVGIKAYLQKTIQEGTLAQTLLFVGPMGVGKSLFAKAVAKALLGKENSPDLHLYAPEGKSGLYAIDTLREMMDKEHEAPFEASGKVFILENAERMQPAAANALLKTLEEPTAETTFILLSGDEHQILPTILSRCTVLRFQGLSEEHVSTLLRDRGHPIRFAKCAQGSIGRALMWAEKPEMEEQRNVLFSLLAQTPSYLELYRTLALLDEKEEDPLMAADRLHHLLSSIFMWHRDQHVRQIGGAEDFLFFPDAPRGDLKPLPEVMKKIEQTRLALERNLKPSACFLHLF